MNTQDDINLKETIEKSRLRADVEYDYFVNIGLKINDNLLLVNSAVIAILISGNNITLFKYPILFLVISSFLSLISLYCQKELSRNASIKFRLAAIAVGKALEEKKAIRQEELPSISDFRKKSGFINWSINFALLFFAIAFILIIVGVYKI